MNQQAEQQLTLCQHQHWIDQLLPIIAEKQRTNSGNCNHYVKSINALSAYDRSSLRIDNGIVYAGTSGQSTASVEAIARSLCPWRKGPFSICGTLVDSEWQCQKKWNRLRPYIEPENCRVLDVGGGNGYFGWRLLAEGAERVIIVDPVPLYWAQFQLISHLLNPLPIAMLPISYADVPDNECFDLVLCMGVLYHSPEPFVLLRSLRKRLAAGGSLILETLVVDGGDDTVLVPTDRYAAMKNVWTIPSIAALHRWLIRCGFTRIETSEAVATTTKEQRTTAWSNQKSLYDFLDPENQSRTIEGYPAPVRVIFRVS